MLNQMLGPRNLWFATAVIVAQLTFVAPSHAASEYRAKADLHATLRLVPCVASRSPCQPGAVVTVSLTASRVAGPGTSCEAARTSVFLEGPYPVSGRYEEGAHSAPFPVTTGAVAEYVLGEAPRLVTVYGEGACEDAEYNFQKPYLLLTLPAAHTVLTPGTTAPQPDPPSTDPATLGETETIAAQRNADGWLAAISCAAVAAPRSAPGAALGPIGKRVCESASTIAVGAQVSLGAGVTDAHFGALPSTTFSPAAFRQKATPFGACSSSRTPKPARMRGRARHARQGAAASKPTKIHGASKRRLALACRKLAVLMPQWLADLGEEAWLYRALAVSVDRYASAAAAEAFPETRNEALWLQRAAALGYVKRAVRLQAGAAVIARKMASTIRGTRLDAPFTTSFVKRALAVYRAGSDFPIAARQEFAGEDIQTSSGLLSAIPVPGPAPRSLAALFADAAVIPVPGPPAFIAPRGAAAVLQAWLGSSAAHLRASCGTDYAAAWAELKLGLEALGSGSEDYGQVLASTFIAEHEPGYSECGASPESSTSVADPLSNLFEGSVTPLIASLAADPAGVGNSVGLSVAPDGSILVPDQLLRIVHHYDSTGHPLATIGEGGSGPGQFTAPGDVAVDASGHMYVSDYAAHRVLRFGAHGAFEFSWGEPGSGAGQFEYPAGLVWSPATNEIVVADSKGPSGGGRLEAFDLTGKFLWATASREGEPGYLARPRGLAIAPDGTIAVADSNLEDPRIVLFGSDGSYLGQTPAELGFVQPYGVAYDPAGHLWVADKGAGIFEMQGFTSIAKHYSVFGSSGTVIAPASLAFAGSRLLILDYAGAEVLSVPVAGL